MFTGFFEDRRGGTALIFALCLPMLLALGCGAVEFAIVEADKSHMQDAADAAALNAADQLSMLPADAIVDRAKAFALSHLDKVADHSSVTVEVTTTDDPRSVQISISNYRTSFFGDLLPAGGFRSHVASKASPLNKIPLCVLAHGGILFRGLALDATWLRKPPAGNRSPKNEVR